MKIFERNKMSTKQFKIASLILMITGLLSIACQTDNGSLQSNSTTNHSANILIVKPQKTIDSKVCGAAKEIKYSGEDTKSFILSQPLPEIWIVKKEKDANEISCSGTKISLSEKSTKILQQYWQDKLEYNYLSDFVETKNGLEGIRRDTKLSKSYLEAKRNLEKMSISEGESSRNISPIESEEMLLFLTEFANKISQIVKNKT